MSAKLYPDGNIYSIKCLILAIFFEPTLKYVNNDSNIHNFDHSRRKDYSYIFNKLKTMIKSDE